MSSGTSPIAQLDAMLGDLFAGWNTYSTAIATLIVVYAGYLLFFTKDPDAHPYMLARQSVEAHIRQRGESAVFRAHEVPHGYPLKRGLGVKDPGTPKWTVGRNGDLRDIWRAALNGPSDEGNQPRKRGTIYRVMGKHVVESSLDSVSQEINIMGQHIRDSKAQTVAVCLSDSVELLSTIFAGAFYGFKTVIVPHSLPSEALAAYIQQEGVDTLIAEAGAVDISLLAKAQSTLKGLIWVARQGSQHLGWSQPPEEIDGKIEVAVWHELIKAKHDSVGPELPPSDPATPVHPLATVWTTATGPGEIVEYSQDNLVAGIAALGASLPRGERLTSSDVVLPVDSLSRSYPLCLTLAALYVHASVALTSVAGEHVDFALATMSVSPTVIIASSHTIADYHARYMGPRIGPLTSIGSFFQRQDLDNGVMPSPNFFTRLLTVSPTADLSLSDLRLLCISHRVDSDPQNQLTYEQLTDLRAFTGARVVYALTAANVAGAICQTNAYDYRRESGPSHFGPPLSSVEVMLTGHNEDTGAERAREGEIICSGPAVVGGTCTLGFKGEFRHDNTLALKT